VLKYLKNRTVEVGTWGCATFFLVSWAAYQFLRVDIGVATAAGLSASQLVIGILPDGFKAGSGK